jgi:hypothetical protein
VTFCAAPETLARIRRARQPEPPPDAIFMRYNQSLL